MNNFLNKMKMNNFNKAVAGLLAAITITACNKEEGTVNNDPVAVQFTAQIGNQESVISAITRASGDTWDDGDDIGVYMVDNGTSDVAMEAENIGYRHSSGGNFGPVSENKTIFFPVNGDDTFDFIAYYPYTTGMADLIYPVDVADQADLKKIDLLYAESHTNNTAGYDKYDPDVNLTFKHMLSKFVLKIKPGSGLTLSDLDDANLKIYINGMNTRAKFNLATGTLSGATANIPFEPYMKTPSKVHEAILLPAGITNEGDWFVEFVVRDTDTYVWKMPAGTKFEQDKEHTWEISVQKTPVVISSSIKDWVTGTGGDGEAW